MININSLIAITSWIAIILFISSTCRKLYPTKKELSRKIVHIGIGPIIPLAWWFNIQAPIAIAISSIVTIGLLINYQFRLLPAIEDVSRNSYGTIAYGLSITLLLILFWPTNAAAVSAGVLIMAFGDGLAGLIGPNLDSPSWLILRERKSIAGTLTMFITGVIVLSCMASLAELSFHIGQMIMISCIATMLEQVSKWGIDNITVPIGVAYIWTVIF